MLGALFRWLFGGCGDRPGRTPRTLLTVEKLAQRLGVSPRLLDHPPIDYRSFEVPKRTGGRRTILAPAKPLKALQRKVLRKILGGLRAHPAAVGFERGQSIVSNALPHAGQQVVIRLDLKDFFGSTTERRVREYFGFIGWDDRASKLLARICTHRGSLPQGAPTSPRLSNLVNYHLDARLAALAASRQLAYTRYADDITFSGAEQGRGGAERINSIIHAAKQIIEDEGYQVHTHKKLRISRRHDRQLVTGLVVNARPNLPRATRQRLRAIEHHLATSRPATLTAEQLRGWQSLRAMIQKQSAQPS